MVRRSVFSLVLVAGTFVGCTAVADTALFEREMSEGVAPEAVVVVVESFSAWRPNIEISALSCDGRFRIAGAYSDTTVIRGVVPPDSAIAIVNELLALNFFEQPSKFGKKRFWLKRRENGMLGLLHEDTWDAGMDTITLTIGTSMYEVSLAYPAHGAPEALHQWVRRFAAFMKECRGW